MVGIFFLDGTLPFVGLSFSFCPSPHSTWKTGGRLLPWFSFMSTSMPIQFSSTPHISETCAELSIVMMQDTQQG